MCKHFKIIEFTLKGLDPSTFRAENPGNKLGSVQNLFKRQPNPAKYKRNNTPFKLELDVEHFRGAIKEDQLPTNREKITPWWNKTLANFRAEIRRLFNRGKVA